MGKDAPPIGSAGNSSGDAHCSPEEAKPVYTGEPISLNLKDVDLKDFFRLIHEISGLNIIIDPNVSGSVTLVLDSVPWDQALDIVLKNNRLGKVMEGNVLRIAKVETLTAEQEGQTKLAAARMDAAPLVTVFRPINYAKASDIATLLKTWAGGGALSRRGTVLVDARANTLIISDVQSQIPIIENILSKLDKKAKQVSIEARVVLATADFTRTLSAALSGSVRNLSGSTQAGGATGAGNTADDHYHLPTSPHNHPAQRRDRVWRHCDYQCVVTLLDQCGHLGAGGARSGEDHFPSHYRDAKQCAGNGPARCAGSHPDLDQQHRYRSVCTTATLQLTVTPQVTDDNNIFLIINVINALRRRGDCGRRTRNQHPASNHPSVGSRRRHRGLRRHYGDQQEQVCNLCALAGKHPRPGAFVQNEQRFGQRPGVALLRIAEDTSDLAFPPCKRSRSIADFREETLR